MPKLLKAERFYLEIETEINENDRQCISTIIELKCNDITVERTTVEISETKYNGTITGLSPFTNYSCSARVKNDIGASEWSDIAIVATKSTGKITFKLINDIFLTKIFLKLQIHLKTSHLQSARTTQLKFVGIQIKYQEHFLKFI